MAFKLYDYQREAIDDTRARFAAGAVRVPVVAATGLGKTEIFIALIDEWMADNPGKRVLVVAHTNELIEQAAKRARQRMPHRRVGIVKGAMNNATADVVISSRQTLASEKRRNMIKRVGLIVIDECHHAVSTNTYGKILRHFAALPEQDQEEKEFTPQAIVAGFTATLIRGDKAKLSTVWQDCTFSRDILFGIRNGYLLDVQGERVIVDDLNLRGVKMSGGDYSESALAEELERSFAIETIAAQYVKLASDRKGIAFWPLVATAQHAAEVFNEAGIPSGVVHGAMHHAERVRVLDDLRSGAIQVVHNAMVLTEGFDEPSIEAIVIGRPTKSPVLYPQMVGRGLRKDHSLPADVVQRPCLLMDVTGASEINGLRSVIDLSPERKLKELHEEHPEATLSELDEMLEQEIEQEIEAQRAGASYEFESDEYAGPVTTKTFDPLGRSYVWGETPGGVKYTVVGGDAFAFVAESATTQPVHDRFDVVLCSKNEAYNVRYDKRPPWIRGVSFALPLDQAIARAEACVDEEGGYGSKSLASRRSAWRTREPSEAQKRLAQFKYGIEPGAMNAGQLSEAIDSAQAALRIDGIVAKVRANVQQSNNS